MKFEKPARIYKYVPLTVAYLIISRNELKFSPPSSFNDPFDCDINLLEFKFGEFSHRVFNEITEIKRMFESYASFRSRENDQNFWENIYKQVQIDKINGSRICCFSLLNDNLLMWAHYADKHKGVCLEFDNSIENRFLNLSDKKDITEGEVGYNIKERINYLKEEREITIYKLFFTKSEEWKYEKEYRMITLNNKGELQQFNPKFLKAIYFGMNVPSDDINGIENLCAYKEYKNLKFYHTLKKPFGFEFIERSW